MKPVACLGACLVVVACSGSARGPAKGTVEAYVQQAAGQPDPVLCFGGITGTVGQTWIMNCTETRVEGFDWSAAAAAAPGSDHASAAYRWASAGLQGEISSDRRVFRVLQPPDFTVTGPDTANGVPAPLPAGYRCDASLPPDEEAQTALFSRLFQSEDRPPEILTWNMNAEHVLALAPRTEAFEWLCANGVNAWEVPVLDMLVASR